MDLVSSTLDKYLKHRFNGTDLQRETTNGTTPVESSNNDCKLPVIQLVTICNTQPCCVSIREDLKHLAAGFENSIIYLWDFKKEPASQANSEPVATPAAITNERLEIEAIQPLLAHSGPVYGIEFVHNNDLMISCSEDTTIRLWCLKQKCNLTIYRGHNYPIWALDISLQSKLFVSASMDTTARLWQFDKMTPVRIFCGHDDDVECVKFHPNEKYIATGSSDATVRLWSVSDGKMVRLMVGHQEPIISLSFLPNGKLLASASRDGSVKLWSLATNLVTTELSFPASFTISFSPDQKFVSSCGLDNILRLWQVDDATLTERKQLNLNDRDSNLIQSLFHIDNKLFVVSYKETKRKTE